MRALWFARRAVLTGVLGAVLSGGAIAKPFAPQATFAVLPLVAGDLDMAYAVFPSPTERADLGAKLTRELVQLRGGAALPTALVTAELARAGFDQDSQYRRCASAACARRVGRALHVDTVVYGSVTRYMAMIWGTDVSLVDVATGRSVGPYALGYKGDYTALSTGVGTLAEALSKRMIADAAARNRARATAQR